MMSQPIANTPGTTAPRRLASESPVELVDRQSPVASPFGSFERDYFLGDARSRDIADPIAVDYLLGRLSERRYAILSLDVFDTLMLRNEKCERRRFWEIAERWRQKLPAGSRGIEVSDLYRARLRAAEISYSCGPIVAATQEGRLDSLIGVALSLLKLPNGLVSSFMTIELEYEAENLAPNPLILSVLGEYARQEGRVMLLSDMYLAGAQIYSIICQFGLKDIAPYVYSSADITLNKRSGTIFAPAAQNLGVRGSDILHIGDNFQSDFAMPRLSGWAAQHLPIPLCEERLREGDERDFSARVAGADS